MWTDISSFSQGETDRTPKSWKLQVGTIRLVVTRNKDYPPDMWIASAEPFFGHLELSRSNIESAKEEAKTMLHIYLHDALEILNHSD